MYLTFMFLLLFKFEYTDMLVSVINALGGKKVACTMNYIMCLIYACALRNLAPLSPAIIRTHWWPSKCTQLLVTKAAVKTMETVDRPLLAPICTATVAVLPVGTFNIFYPQLYLDKLEK